MRPTYCTVLHHDATHLPPQPICQEKDNQGAVAEDEQRYLVGGVGEEGMGEGGGDGGGRRGWGREEGMGEGGGDGGGRRGWGREEGMGEGEGDGHCHYITPCVFVCMCVCVYA